MKSRMLSSLLGGTLFLVLSTNGPAQDRLADEKPKPAEKKSTTPRAATEFKQLSFDAQVLSKVHHTNQFEIKAGKLAQEKGARVDVRDYGERLWRDHQSADEKVRELSEELDLPLVKPQPQTPKAKEHAKKQKQLMNKLQKLEGAEFDRVYLRGMINGHEYAINTLQQALPKLEHLEVRDLIENLIPILDQHHDLAVDIARETQARVEPATRPNQ